jgi:hypothetical protein
MKRGLPGIALLLIACHALVGCGGGGDAPPTYPVSGKVALDGEAVAEGQIVFRDAAGKLRSDGGKITNGEFAFEATAGKKKVVITAQREVAGEKGEPAAPGEPAPPLIEQYIPSAYNDQTTLDIEVTESAEKNTFDFNLSSRPGQ